MSLSFFFFFDILDESKLCGCVRHLTNCILYTRGFTPFFSSYGNENISAELVNCNPCLQNFSEVLSFVPISSKLVCSEDGKSGWPFLPG